MALNLYQCNYIKELEEEIALEGLDGITTDSLWERMLDRSFCSVKPTTVQTKEFLWKAVVCMNTVKFYLLPIPRSPIYITKRLVFDRSGHYLEPYQLKMKSEEEEGEMEEIAASVNSAEVIERYVPTAKLPGTFEMEDPRIIWILERVMTFCQTEDKDLVVRMLKKHDSRALKKLYHLISGETTTRKPEGFFVYQTQFKRRFKKKIRLVKIHAGNKDGKYRCSVDHEIQYRDQLFMQLHIHFGLHRWERFPFNGKMFYFILRECAVFPQCETLKEARATMPKMFYVGQVDFKSVRSYCTFFSTLDGYFKNIYLNPSSPFATKSNLPANLLKPIGELKRPPLDSVENSSGFMRKGDDIEKFFKSQDVPSFPQFDVQLLKQIAGSGKRRDKLKLLTVDDFVKPEVLSKYPKLRSNWYKKKKGPLPKSKANVLALDSEPPKTKMLSIIEEVINRFDWCLAKVSNCTLQVLFTDYLAKLNVHQFDDEPELQATHVAFLQGVLEIWNLHVKNLLQSCHLIHIKGKGVMALYNYYRERRDKISNLIFELFHPIVENLLHYLLLHSPRVVSDFRESRGRLEGFYIICWDTCEYLELCLSELKTIHNHKKLRPVVPCLSRFLGVLKLLVTLSSYWKSRRRFLDILNRLHSIITIKVQRLLNTERLFRLPNRIAMALCKDIIDVTEFWQNSVEQDRMFSQKLDFDKLSHIRNVAKSILDVLSVMKSYDHVFCHQCYDAENESYKLDAVVLQVKELVAPLISPGFDYLDTINKAQWTNLIADFKHRCSTFDKEASILIVDAIKKTKSTRNITNILTHLKRTTTYFKMDSLFRSIFSQLDISSQFTKELLDILEVFLKTSYTKDAVVSFGLSSKSMQYTRTLFYVVQKHVHILFTIGEILPNIYDKVVANYLRCVDIFTSYEIGLYKVWLRRFVNYTHNVVSKSLIKLAYDKDPLDDNRNNCSKHLEGDFFDKSIANEAADDRSCNRYSFLEYLPQFRPYLIDALQNGIDKIDSLHSIESPDEYGQLKDEAHYKSTLLLKFGLDLDHWYSERQMLNYNFITKLALGLCTQNDEQLEANVYFLLEQTLKRFVEEDRKNRLSGKMKILDGLELFQPYDCCSSSGSITRISELLTDNSCSIESSGKGIKKEIERFLVDRDTTTFNKVTDLSYLKNDVPLFIAIREHFREKVVASMGGDPSVAKVNVQNKVDQVLTDLDLESDCSENFAFPQTKESDKHVDVKQSTDDNSLSKFEVLFKTPVNRLYNYKEMAFVLWLNSTKMKYVNFREAHKSKNGHPVEIKLSNRREIPCTCNNVTGCDFPNKDFDWLNDVAKSTPGTVDKTSSKGTELSFTAPVQRTDQTRTKQHAKMKRSAVEKYETPMNDIFVDEERLDSSFRAKFNIYLTKLINDLNQPKEAIGPNQIIGRIRGQIKPDGTLDKGMWIRELTDDDMPEYKIASEIANLTEMQKNQAKTAKRRFKREWNDAVRQAGGDSSDSEKAMQAMSYLGELRKTVPGVYTGCKHTLNKMSWDTFIGDDILKEHGYTISASQEPFTYVACRDIENLEELGFNLPPETFGFAFNNFDKIKFDVIDIVTIYNKIIDGMSIPKLMALKKYVRPVERSICQGLKFCGLRTLNITNHCKELIFKMNRLTIVDTLMTEIEVSIKNTLRTMGSLNFYKIPRHKTFTIKEFFAILDDNIKHCQIRFLRLYKLIPKRLIKLETLLYREKTGKCEYLIAYYRCIERTMFRTLIQMVTANLRVFNKFVLGEVRARFYVAATFVDPNVLVKPDLISVRQQLLSFSERILRFLKGVPRWFDGTCSKVPVMKKKDTQAHPHSYCFAEDLLGSHEVAEELQKTYEAVSYVMDSVDNYIDTWARFDHLWVEDIEDIFLRFSTDRPSLQDYFDVFSFYHDIIVALYKMPDCVDMYCIRVKIADIKRKMLLLALSWRAYAKNSLNDSINVESQRIFVKMHNAFSDLSLRVITLDDMKQVLKTAYYFGDLNSATDLCLNSIRSKNSLIKLWLPKHLREDDTAIDDVIIQNMDQLRLLVMYRKELMVPYLNKLTPRFECIQCSPDGTTTDFNSSFNLFNKFFQTVVREHDFGNMLNVALMKLLDDMNKVKDTCSWAVMKLTYDHLQASFKAVELLKQLYPKVTIPKLSTPKGINSVLGIEKPVAFEAESSEPSLEALLKLLK